MTKQAWTIAPFLCLSLAGLSCMAPMARAAFELGGPASEVDLAWGVKIPLRDGTRLNATVYKPKEMHAALPVVCTMTPYIADTYHDRAMYFVAQWLRLRPR